MPYSRDALVAMLRTHGIVPTEQRLGIAQVLFDRGEHLAADQILALVNRQHAEVSKATVYNTLSLFCDCGLIREVHVDSKRVFYDPNTLPHYHLYNVDTSEITDIAATPITISGLPELPAGMTTASVDLVIRVRAL